MPAENAHPEQRPAGKRVSESRTEQINVVMPQHLNGHGILFGGQLAMWIDVVAGVVAARHCRDRITTAAMDNLQFRESVGESTLLVMRGRLTYVGRTSMEVRVDSYAEDTRSGARRLINTAFVIEVAIDDSGRPREVPPLIPETPEEMADFQAGEKRRKMRKEKYALYDYCELP